MSSVVAGGGLFFGQSAWLSFGSDRSRTAVYRGQSACMSDVREFAFRKVKQGIRDALRGFEIGA